MPSEDIVFFAPDLTQRAPRSPRVRLGGFALLPRMLDKCRAVIAGTAGQYEFNCMLDEHFISFTKVDPNALKEAVATGKSDGEMLKWIMENAGHVPQPWEIAQWSTYQDQRGPNSDAETWTFYAEYVKSLSMTREDIKTYIDAIDLDDYCSFGGRP